MDEIKRRRGRQPTERGAGSPRLNVRLSVIEHAATERVAERKGISGVELARRALLKEIRAEIRALTK